MLDTTAALPVPWQPWQEASPAEISGQGAKISKHAKLSVHGPVHLWGPPGLPPAPTAQPEQTHTSLGYPGPRQVPTQTAYQGSPLVSPPGARSIDPVQAEGQDVGDSAPVPTCQAGRTFSMSFRLIPSPSSSFPFPHLDQKRKKSIKKSAHSCILPWPRKQLSRGSQKTLGLPPSRPARSACPTPSPTTQILPQALCAGRNAGTSRWGQVSTSVAPILWGDWYQSFPWPSQAKTPSFLLMSIPKPVRAPARAQHDVPLHQRENK